MTPFIDQVRAVKTGAELVAMMIGDEGRGRASEGAVAFADWIVEDPISAESFLIVQGELTVGQLRRLLAGTVLPDDRTAEIIGRATKGAIDKLMFQRPLPGAVEVLAKGDAPAPAPPVTDGFRITIGGLMGEAPTGPLFRAVADPQHPRAFAVVGLGHTFLLDAPRARAMREAIDAGLKVIA